MFVEIRKSMLITKYSLLKVNNLIDFYGLISTKHQQTETRHFANILLVVVPIFHTFQNN